MTAPTAVVLTAASVASLFGSPLTGVAFGAWFVGRESIEKFTRQALVKQPAEGE